MKFRFPLAAATVPLALGSLSSLTPCRASGADADFHILKVDDLSANYDHYIQPTFSTYFPGYVTDGMGLNLQSSLLKYGIWNTSVQGLADSSQYQFVSFHMEVGVRVSKELDLSVWHTSSHTLDSPDAWGRHFEVLDAVEVKVHFIRSDSNPTIF